MKLPPLGIRPTMTHPHTTSSRLSVLVLVATATFLTTGSLTGQEIMTYEEYQQVDHEEPYTYRMKGDAGELFYFGSRHSFDPEDDQFDRLREQLERFSPDVIYTEGFPVAVDSLTERTAINRYGEFGVAWKYASDAEIPVHSLEPDRKQEIAHLEDESWTDEQIIVFYTLRQVSQSNRQNVDLDLDKLLPQYLKSLEERFGLSGPKTLQDFESSVDELLPDVENWKEAPQHYFYPGPQDPERFTNRISTESNQFRDRYHAKLIADAVHDGKRVFVIAGSAHAVMQEPALETMLDGS